MVSILVCCRNEEKYIEKCIHSLINQKGIRDGFEILAIDGISDDNTFDLLENLSKKYENLRVFKNPQKVKPPAVNIGFREAKGKYIAICDAHTEYAEDYISKCLQEFKINDSILCVGGPIISVGESNFGKANALAMSHPIGIGNAKHRFPDFEGFAEMACFPVFDRKVLNKIGYYDEFFDINHDDEYCYRLRKSGGKVYLTPKAKSYYYVRNSPTGLFKQYFSYGLWQIAFLKKHKIPISLRQLVPFVFFSLTAILLIMGLIIGYYFLAFGLPVIYVSTLFLSSIPVIFRYGILIGINFPLAVFILHFSYAVGFISGFFKFRNTIFKNTHPRFEKF